MKYTLFFLILLFHQLSFVYAQKNNHPFSYSVYSDVYVGISNPLPPHEELNPDFCFNHNRTRLLRTNLTLIQAHYKGKKIRGNVGLMDGTYSRYNLSSEPRWARAIYQANLGVRLHKKEDMWLDAGVFESYIGHENAIGSLHYTATRSLAAELSPYYITGVRMVYTSADSTLLFGFYLTNGWQHIVVSNLSQQIAIGMQVQYINKQGTLFNYSNFYGSAYVYGIPNNDSVRVDRMFHDVYVVHQLTPKWHIKALFDMGIDQWKAYWFNTNVQATYNPAHTVSLAARAEWLHDPKQTLLRTPVASTSEIWGLSANTDFSFYHQKCMLRAEAKYLWSDQNKFTAVNGTYTKSQWLFITSLCIKL